MKAPGLLAVDHRRRVKTPRGFVGSARSRPGWRPFVFPPAPALVLVADEPVGHAQRQRQGREAEERAGRDLEQIGDDDLSRQREQRDEDDDPRLADPSRARPYITPGVVELERAP